MSSHRIALVYDRLTTGYGGAERVLEALHQLWPEADLFTSVWDPAKTTWLDSHNWKPQTTWIQKIPGAKHFNIWGSLLRPLAFESLDLSNYDIIVSVTSGEAKGILTKPHQTHLCYLLTPPRYLYSHRNEYLKTHTRVPGSRWIAQKYLDYLKWWDQAASWRPDALIPISNLVKQRALDAYPGRTITEPIYPPVELLPIALPPGEQLSGELLSSKLKPAVKSLPWSDYLLFVGRLQWYKLPHLCVELALELDTPLVIVGSGDQKETILAIAPNKTYVAPALQSVADAMAQARASHKTIILLENLAQPELAKVYAHAKCLLMPGIDDFGITALEALSQATPVIINTKSGAAEILTDGLDAIKLETPNVKSLKLAYEQLLRTKFSARKLQQTASKFSTKSFIGQIQETVYDVLNRKEL